MQTRSAISKTFVRCLPYSNEPIYVRMNELYTAWKEDYIQFIFESKLMTPEKRDKIHHHNDNMKDEWFLSFYHQDPHAHVAAVHNQHQLTAAMNNNAMLIYKPSFINKRSHITGRIDAICHADILPQMEIPSPVTTTKFFMMVLDTKTKFENLDYSKIKATAFYLYGPLQSPVLIYSIQTKKYEWFTPSKEDIDSVKTLVRNIRHTKRYSDAFWDYGTFNDRVRPNMKNSSDLWEDEKKEFADRIGELTKLWRCTIKYRKNAIKNGVFSWRSIDCSASILGFPDGQYKDIIDAIIRVNRGDYPGWLHVHNSQSLDVIRSTDDFVYVDFEWIDEVYLVGIYDGQEYTSYWASSLDEKDIKDMYIRVIDHLKDKKVVYWYAEKNKWKSDLEKLSIEEIPITWIDLCSVVRDGVVVKGAFDFKLKNFTRVFYENGEMPYFLDDFECQNGKDSILFAKEYYQTMNESIQQQIEKYNRFDCEAMFYITRCLKKY